MPRLLVRSRLIPAVLLAALLVLGGCGGAGGGGKDTKAEYERGMQKIAKDINANIKQISGRDRDLMRKSRQELEKGIERADDLDPPEKVESIHEDYLEGLRETADVMEEYEDFDPEKQEDAEQTLKMFEDLDRTMGKVEQAHKDFKEAGYDVTG